MRIRILEEKKFRISPIKGLNAESFWRSRKDDALSQRAPEHTWFFFPRGSSWKEDKRRHTVWQEWKWDSVVTVNTNRFPQSPTKWVTPPGFSISHHSHTLRQLMRAHLCYSEYVAHTHSLLLAVILSNTLENTHTYVELVWSGLPPLSTVKQLGCSQPCSGDKGGETKRQLVFKPAKSQGCQGEEFKVTLQCLHPSGSELVCVDWMGIVICKSQIKLNDCLDCEKQHSWTRVYRRIVFVLMSPLT